MLVVGAPVSNGLHQTKQRATAVLGDNVGRRGGHGGRVNDGERRRPRRAWGRQNHVRGTRRVHGPLHGAVNGLYVDTGKKCPTAVVDGSGRAPWKTGQNRTWHTPRTRTLTRTRERAVRGHGKKVPDARHRRKWTQAIEKWEKPRTWHTPRTQTLTWTRERAIRGPRDKVSDAHHG